MSKVLGSIFGFGDKMKRRLRDAVSNPRDYLEMTADENQNEWRKNPDERSMGFFNPVPLGRVDPFLLRKQMKEAIDEIPSLSRRDFMKKSAGLAAGTTVGAGVTAKLLRKFAPEERAAVKEANVVKQSAVEAVPKYRYNSLKEYLDDAVESETRGFKSIHPEDDADWLRYNIKQRLLDDERTYFANKERVRLKNNGVDWGFQERIPEYHTVYPNDPSKNIKWTDAFSPQAKKEMKWYKEDIAKRKPGESWADRFPSDIDEIYNGLKGIDY